MANLLFSLLLVLATFHYEQVNAAESITAKAWLVSDENGRKIDGENTHDVRSIASITKLVTVMAVLDAGQDLNQKIGKFTRKELIQLALVKSDNNAAKLLCDNYPTGLAGCIRYMNFSMFMLGLENTKFVEPTGLSVMNVSTAEELVTIVLAAKEYPEIVEASKMPMGKIQTSKKSWLTFNNTNTIVREKKYDFIVSKTGFIRASGGCIVMMLDTGFSQRIVVLLGSKDTKTRIPEADRLVQMFL